MEPKHVTVYGNDHSPWVQAVLLGLHDRGIPYTLVTVPPLRVFLGGGVLMPAARIDDGPWIYDSAAILAAVGYGGVRKEDAGDLVMLFRSSAARRTASATRFWSRFSLSRDGHPNALRRHWNHFWRAFSIFYFFNLISVAGRTFRPEDPFAGRDAMCAMQSRLDRAGPFFGGASPDTVDLQLFGLVQMCSSIPVPELGMLQQDPKLDRLRQWVAEMQSRFSDYDRLYSATDYAPAQPAPPTTTATERAAFWLGAVTMWLAFPVTIPLVVIYVLRSQKIQRSSRPEPID